jgi:hypothetical protein
VHAYYLLPHAQYTLTKNKNSWHFFVVPCAYANNLLPHAQYPLSICYRMRSVRLFFVAACLEYADKANHSLILPIQLNQVKTYEISEKSKKTLLHIQAGLKGI